MSFVNESWPIHSGSRSDVNAYYISPPHIENLSTIKEKSVYFNAKFLYGIYHYKLFSFNKI